MNKMEILQTLTYWADKWNRSYFYTSDLRKIFKENRYLNVYINRLVRSNILVRVYKGVYILPNIPYNLDKLATSIYTPSYISLQTSLYRYGVINQGPYKLTMVTAKRSKNIKVVDMNLNYRHIDKNLFFGYVNKDRVLIAELENRDSNLV